MDAMKADLMRFGWIGTEARLYEKATWKRWNHEMESAIEEICHVEEMEQISQILD